MSKEMKMIISDVHYSENIKVDFKEAWEVNFEQKIDNALNNMAETTLSRARMTVPRKTGKLSESGRVVSDKQLEKKVVFGNSDIKYAGYQERGMAIDGSRVVRNYTTPGTGSRYLLNAFESVLKEGIKNYL